MRPNPGGYIPPDEIIGRDRLVSRLWEVLERQSLLLVAERRIGKTCVITKMRATAREGVLAIWMDVEGVRTPLEFVEVLLRQLDVHLSGLRRWAIRTQQLLARFGEAQAGPVKLPPAAALQWKALLATLLEDVERHHEGAIVLFLDELPLMLHNVKGQGGETQAMEVLDVLRTARQTHPKLRMVFTGSIGLHHVISSLRDSGYANDPTNDMFTDEVPPLDEKDAEHLAAVLLEGTGVQTEEPEAVAAAVAHSVDCNPYYVHYLVAKLPTDAPVTPEAVQAVVSECLTDGSDPWHLAHYRQRIGNYYALQEQPLVLAVLDTVAASDQPLRFKDLFNLVKARVATEAAEEVRVIADLLRRDHYLQLQPGSTYDFKFPLVKRWWRLNRGLQA